jgi:hypothetical protein
MTSLDKVRKRFRIPRHVAAKPYGPFIRKRGEMRIDGGSKLLHYPGERIVEVFVLTLAESIAGHFDPCAKATVIGIIGRYLCTAFLRENSGDQGKPPVIEVRPRSFPIDFIFANWPGHSHKKRLSAG